MRSSEICKGVSLMSWVTSDRTCSKKALSMLRGALIDEISATDLYDELASLIPEDAEVLQEIKKDEINHQGRLMSLIMKYDPGQLESFNKGLEQEG